MPLTDAERKQKEYEQILEAIQGSSINELSPSADDRIDNYVRSAVVADLARADAEGRGTGSLVGEQLARGIASPILGLAARAGSVLPEQTQRRMRDSGGLPYGDAETLQGDHK